MPTREKPTKKETIVVRVDAEMKRELGELAKENRREFSDFIRCMIEDGLRDRVRIQL